MHWMRIHKTFETSFWINIVFFKSFWHMFKMYLKNKMFSFVCFFQQCANHIIVTNIMFQNNLICIAYLMISFFISAGRNHSVIHSSLLRRWLCWYIPSSPSTKFKGPGGGKFLLNKTHFSQVLFHIKSYIAFDLASFVTEF